MIRTDELQPRLLSSVYREGWHRPIAREASARVQAPAVVSVVDDDRAVRDSLKWLIESVGLRVAGYLSAEAFLEGYDPQTPGCLVLDARLPRMNGIELQERLASTGVAIPIIFLTGHANVPLVIRAMRAGAVDFIEKPVDEERLLARVHSAVQRDIIARRERELRREAKARLAELTPREREILQLVVRGEPNKKIAFRLRISTKTVEAHRAKVMSKTESRSVAQLVRLCLAATPTAACL